MNKRLTVKKAALAGMLAPLGISAFEEEGDMLTVFLPVVLDGGLRITINPAMVIAVEPDAQNPNGDRCLLWLSGVVTTKDPETGQNRVNSQTYWVAESPDSLLARIHTAQHKAQTDWIASIAEATRLAAKSGSEGDDEALS